jgi:hypothetical protein
MKKQGLVVVAPTPADAAYFREVGQRVVAQLEAESKLSPAILAAIREAKAAAPAAAGAAP